MTGGNAARALVKGNAAFIIGLYLRPDGLRVGTPPEKGAGGLICSKITAMIGKSKRMQYRI